MAGDWIKMRVGLTTNPKVLRIAECLLEDGAYLEWSGLHYGLASYPAPDERQQRAERHAALRVTRYVTVTALLRFWGYANEHAKGEFIAGILPEDVDEIVGLPGFAAAIEAIGWGVFDPNGGLSLPDFHQHNTSVDARSSGAERQKRYREKHKESDAPRDAESDVTRNVTVTHREDKSREDKKEQKQAVAEIPLKDGSSFAVTASLIDEWGAAYPRLDVLAEIAKARAWCVANPDKRKTRAGAAKFLNGWLSRSHGELPAPSAADQPGGGRRRLA